ncbi:MAG: carboxypeptidase-like regulatory domain-containing protein [Planctomycetes bacterium]|jgi:hypothetical protein|nr:carboxypeptidase-like regulatory domain-containing protein [Planctomycetota bacterium]
MQLVLLLLMMGLAACGGPPPQILSGRTVTAGGTGVAATVRVLAVPDDGRDWPVAASAESGPDGTFNMEVPSGGRLAALAEAPGLRSPCVFVERGHLRSAFVFVLRPALPPEVLVLDDGGAPAVGAEVRLHEAVEGCLNPLGPPEWRPLAVAVPDAAGRCVLLPAPPATGRITARAAGFPIATVAPLPTAGPVEVRLHRGRLLEGIVLDGDGAPVKGARVEASGVTTITDAAGRFLLDSVPSPGQFWLSADAGARGRAERSISGPWRLRNLKAPREAPKSEPGAERRGETVRLEPVRRIAGRILLLVDGELAPAPGITLKAWEQGPSRPWGQRPSRPAAVSGPDGAFTLDGIPLGETALELPDPDLSFACVYFGRPMEWFTVPLLESDLDLVVMRRDPPWAAPPQIRVDAIPVARQERVLERPVTSKLPEKSASISGFVRDPEGRPLPGARVHAVPDPDPSVPDMQMVSSEHWEVRTNSLGRFRIQDLVGDRFALEVCGSYATRARLRGVPPAAEKIVLIADENWFETAQRIEGRVLDAGGRGVAGVKVRGDPEGFCGVSREETTDAEGRFWLPGLRPGPHRVTVTADGRRPVVLSGVLCGRQDLRVLFP